MAFHNWLEKPEFGWMSRSNVTLPSVEPRTAVDHYAFTGEIKCTACDKMLRVSDVTNLSQHGNTETHMRITRELCFRYNSSVLDALLANTLRELRALS